MDTNGVRANLQMVGTKIIKMEINNDFTFLNPLDEKIERIIDVSYKTSDPFSFEGDENSIAANIQMNIDVVIKNQEGKTSLSLEIEGCFELENSNAREELIQMLPVNGSAALYSVARGIISSMSSHICTNSTIIIPMLNMYQLKNNSTGNTKKDN